MKNLNEEKKKQKKDGWSNCRNIFQLSYEQVVKDLTWYGMLHLTQFQTIIESSISVLKFQPNLTLIESPVTVVGDIHGQSFIQSSQFFDLLNIFQKNGLPPTQKYVFLGDYVDRGDFSIEVITLLFWLKLKYPKQIVLLRGNHQSKILTSKHNFRTECKKKYNAKIYELVVFLFEVIPICCIIDQRYFCVHAGISPDLKKIQQIQKINRFMEIPLSGILCDLLWSDPTEEDRNDWPYNTTRSCSYFYTKSNVASFFKNNSIQTILRGHEVQLRGFRCQEITKKQRTSVITVFSAPNYCKKYNNLGAVACITKKSIKMATFKYIEDPAPLPSMNIMEWSLTNIFGSVGKIFVSLMKKKLNTNENDYKKFHQLKEVKEELERIGIVLEAQKKGNVSQLTSQVLNMLKQREKKVEIQEEYQYNLIDTLKFMISWKSDIEEQGMPTYVPDYSGQGDDSGVFSDKGLSAKCVASGQDEFDESGIFQEQIYSKQSKNCRTQVQYQRSPPENMTMSDKIVKHPINFGPKIQNFKKIQIQRSREKQNFPQQFSQQSF